MEDKKFKRIVICVLIAVGIILGLLALLNGRYISAHDVAFDQWTGKYVDDCRGNVKGAGFIYKMFH